MGSSTVGNTANAAFGASGGGAIVLWLIHSLQAGHLVTPDDSTAIIIAGLLMPVCHALFKLTTALIERYTGVDVDSNGAITPALAPNEGAKQ